jgi:hypothetical protein
MQSERENAGPELGGLPCATVHTPPAVRPPGFVCRLTATERRGGEERTRSELRFRCPMERNHARWGIVYRRARSAAPSCDAAAL